MSIVVLGWLVTAGVLAHNLEEALFLPQWSTRAGRWHATVGRREFLFAVVVLSAALVALAGLAVVAPPRGAVAYLLSGYVLAMVLNVLVPHTLGTITMRSYVPGTATAVLLNLPLGIAFLYTALTGGYVDPLVFAWTGPLTAVVMVAAIPLLFAVGRRLWPDPAGRPHVPNSHGKETL